MSFRPPASRSAVRLALTILTALGFAPLTAHAQITQITAASGLAASDTTLTYTITPDTFVPSYTGSAGGNTLTFTDAGQTLYESQQGGDYTGDFPNGTNLLATINSSAAAAGPLTITFASGVTQFGLTAENAFQGDYNFTFTPFSGTTQLGTFKVGPVEEETNAFLGAEIGSGLITSVQISSGDSIVPLEPGKTNTFAFGPVTFATAPVAAPEPSAWTVLGLGVLGLAGLRVCRRRA